MKQSYAGIDRAKLLREVSTLSSKEYGRIRLICAVGPLDAGALENLIVEVVTGRWNLALSFSRFAQKLPLEEEDNLRNIISRNYYACYQAARALVFLVTRSDVDDHAKLPVRFRDCLEVKDKEKADLLDKWRDIRNEVEYSPFPRIDDLTEAAKESASETEDFLSLCETYLRKRGVQLGDHKAQDNSP